MEIALAAVALVLLLKARQQHQTPQGGSGAGQLPAGGSAPAGDSAGGVSAGAIIGAGTSLLTAGVGLASSIAAGGAAAGGTAAGGTAAGGAAAGGAAAGAGATGGTSGTTAATAAGVTLGAVLAEVGPGLIVLAIIVTIFVTSLHVGFRTGRWNKWTQKHLHHRYALAIFEFEQLYLELLLTQSVTNDERVMRPEWRGRKLVEYTRSLPGYLGFWVMNRPVVTVPPPRWFSPDFAQHVESVQQTFGRGLYVVARALAVEQAWAYNQALDNFYASRGFKNRFAGNISASDSEFWDFVNGHFLKPGADYFLEADETSGIDMSPFSSFEALQSAAAQVLSASGGSYDQLARHAHLRGKYEALNRCATDGYSFEWPGDHEFVRQLNARCRAGLMEARLPGGRLGLYDTEACPQNEQGQVLCIDAVAGREGEGERVVLRLGTPWLLG